MFNYYIVRLLVFQRLTCCFS